MLSFAQLALAWHHEYYEELENAGAGRSHEVRYQLKLHIVPSFATLLDFDVEAGRNMAKDWLRTLSGRAALTPGSLLVVGPTTYARHTASEMLWLLRLCGFRISESYGLLVANFFVDADGDGFILTEAQGGKPFRVRKDNGEVEVTNRKESGRTDAATRLVALPTPLTFLLMRLIEAFHTLPDGSIDATARLIPTIRAEQGGPWATESEATCSTWSTPWTAA